MRMLLAWLIARLRRRPEPVRSGDELEEWGPAQAEADRVETVRLRAERPVNWLRR